MHAWSWRLDLLLPQPAGPNLSPTSIGCGPDHVTLRQVFDRPRSWAFIPVAGADISGQHDSIPSDATAGARAECALPHPFHQTMQSLLVNLMDMT